MKYTKENPLYLNDPSELDSVKGGSFISFNCKSCSKLEVHKYWPYRKDLYSVFLCKPCKTAKFHTMSEGSVYTKDNPIYLNTPSELDTLRGGSWFTFKCEICGKEETHEYWPYRKELYSKFLCKQHKTESTNMETYGKLYNIGTEETIKKSLETQRKNHGGVLWQQTDEGKEHLSKVNKEDHTIYERSVKAYEAKTGYKTPFSNPEVIKLSRERERENHGGLLHVQTEEGRKYLSDLNKAHPEWHNMAVESNKSNHGGILHCQTDEFKQFMSEQNDLHPEWKEKAAESLMNKYGVDTPVKIPGVLDKIAETDRLNHGGIRYHSTEEGRKMISDMTAKYRYRNSKYKYKEEYFDSSWELKYWIYCEDHGIKIARVTEPFIFTFNGENWHKYTPDFIINDDTIVEIKGDNWWNENFDKDKIEYNKARMKCAEDNNVLVLYEKQLLKEIKYVDNKYGKDYLDRFLIYKEETFVSDDGDKIITNASFKN